MEKVITIEDKSYPKLLKEIGKDAPKKLYYKGEYDQKIFENCLAVVGSRNLTSYGRRVAENLVGEVAAAGITVVSGFMYGGDEAAHSATVKAGGKTIAVMPCGIDLIHPQHQKDLYYRILETKGLVLSEFEGKFPPEKWTYPKRNRIVAGLSQAILVIEAAPKSGTLITADFARKFDRKIFAVPGPFFSQNSKGVIKLIKEGAEAVGSAKDILDYYKIKPEYLISKPEEISKSKTTNPEAGLEHKIIEHLKREPMSVDDLARLFRMRVSEMNTKISLMELKGIVVESGGKYH